MRVFLTVGSTRFDALVQAALSKDVLRCLSSRGYSNLTVQCGNSSIDFDITSDRAQTLVKEGINISVWRFKPSLQEEYRHADLIISHAGSGTILDVLRLGKPLIVVPNPTLLDNHQVELATALADLRYLYASTIPDLPRAIETVDPTRIVPFPPFDGSKFQQLLDEEMGFY